MFGQADFRAMFQKSKPAEQSASVAAASTSGGAQSYEEAMAAAGGDPAKITGLVMPKERLAQASAAASAASSRETPGLLVARLGLGLELGLGAWPSAPSPQMGHHPRMILALLPAPPTHRRNSSLPPRREIKAHKTTAVSEYQHHALIKSTLSWWLCKHQRPTLNAQPNATAQRCPLADGCRKRKPQRRPQPQRRPGAGAASGRAHANGELGGSSSNYEDFSYTILTSEPCVLRMFGHDGELNTCAQSAPKKFRDGLHANAHK